MYNNIKVKGGSVIMDISKYRQKLNQIFNEQMRLSKVFLSRMPLIKGGIYKTKLKCGKEGCRCIREGKLHVVWMFYCSERGKTVIRTISEDDAFRYEKFTLGYRRFRQARASLVKLHKEELKIIDTLERGLRKKEMENKIK